MSLIEPTPTYSVLLTSLPTDETSIEQLQTFLDDVMSHVHGDHQSLSLQSLTLPYQICGPLYKAQVHYSIRSHAFELLGSFDCRWLGRDTNCCYASYFCFVHVILITAVW